MATGSKMSATQCSTTATETLEASILTRMEEMQQQMWDLCTKLERQTRVMEWRDHNNQARLHNHDVAHHVVGEDLMLLVSIRDGSLIMDFPRKIDAIARMDSAACVAVLQALEKDAVGNIEEKRSRVRRAIGVNSYLVFS